MSQTLAVDELRVGVYIQLDGGWLSHPFPVSSFRISHGEQIATLRRLGLQRVRWLPEKSLAAAAPGADGTAAAATGAAAAPVAAAPVDAATLERRAALQRHREAAALCEQQHREAARALRGVLDDADTQPRRAGGVALALAQGMLEKMRPAHDIGVRLVTAGADGEAAHGINVSVVSMLIGRALTLPEPELLDLALGALLHDVGKIAVPPRYRSQEPGFTPGELQRWRDHVDAGVKLGQRMGLGEGALQVLAQHHEQADGGGFPQRLGNDRLTLGARVVAIVDHYDTLCNPRTRLRALTPHEAVAAMFSQGRRRFDGAVLNTFIRLMGVYPAGSLVQLTDDRHALVVGANSSRPLKPRVLVHDAGVPRDEALLLDLESLPDVGIRRSVAAQHMPPEALGYLQSRPRVAYYFEPLAREQDCQELAA